MFTGIIEACSKVRRIDRKGKDAVIAVDNVFPFEKIQEGASIAVDGTCLTVIDISEKSLSFFISSETLSRTKAVDYNSSSLVNLERAVKASDRLDGHIVQGHVDYTGNITAVKKMGAGNLISFSVKNGFAPFFVEKGSVTVNGISLTVAELSEKDFSVMFIPETMSRTSFSKRISVGDKVNIECDIIGKYVKKQLESLKTPDYRSLLEKL